MSAVSLRRIQKELGDVRKADGLTGITIDTEDNNMLKWTAVIQGPSSSPYKGGKYAVDIIFPADYPFKAPLIKFKTKIYHPNIDDEGNICIGLLKQDAWKPATKMATVLLSLTNLLSEPNPDDPLVTSIAEEYRTDRGAYEKKAKDYAKKFASS